MGRNLPGICISVSHISRHITKEAKLVGLLAGFLLMELVLRLIVFYPVLRASERCAGEGGAHIILLLI